MKLDFSELITKLKSLETTFNKTEDPVTRFAILETINHIGEKEIPIRDFWYNQYRRATLKTFGANPDADPSSAEVYALRPNRTA